MKGVVLTPPTLHGAWGGICWADLKKGFEKGADTKTYVSTEEAITLIQPQCHCSRSPSCSCWLYDDPEAFCRRHWSISTRNKTQETESQLSWKQVEEHAWCVIVWGNFHSLEHLLMFHLLLFCPLDLSPWPSPYLFVLRYTLLLPLFTLHPHPYLMCPGPQPPGGLHLLLSHPRARSQLWWIRGRSCCLLRAPCKPSHWFTYLFALMSLS